MSGEISSGKREGKVRGRGEFRLPFQIVVNPESTEIWILNSPSYVHIFDILRGGYQRSLNLRGSCRDLQFLPDGRLLINGLARGKMGFIAEFYSAEGERQGEFGQYRYGQDLPEWAGGSIGGEDINLWPMIFIWFCQINTKSGDMIWRANS